MWDDQIDLLNKSFTVLRYDMRGFGKSSLPDGVAYDPCADLSELMALLGIESAVVMGLSLGGWVAIDFTVAYPQKVTALIAADAALMGYEWQQGRPSTLPVEVAQSQGIEAAKQYWIATPLFATALKHPRVLRRLDEMVSDYSGWHWVNENPQILADEPTIYSLGTVSCPTLVIVGEHDIADFQNIANILTDKIPNAKREVIAGAGHMSNMENPEAFNRVLQNFLSE